MREPLLPSHPHGYMRARKDKRLAIIRISKSASTEASNRLEGTDWVHFSEFDGPSIAFVREPYSRFISAIPETMLRMTHWLVEEPARGDRLIIPEDVHLELCSVATSPAKTVAELFLELAEYAFFEAHHEPQYHYLCDRHRKLRVDPRLYPTDTFDASIKQIEEWIGISALEPGQRGNKGGAKPLRGRNLPIDIARRLSRTGVHQRIQHAGFLGLRYRGDAGAIKIRELNEFANRFACEVKEIKFDEQFRDRVLNRYAEDLNLYSMVKEAGGNIHASQLWSDIWQPQH